MVWTKDLYSSKSQHSLRSTRRVYKTASQAWRVVFVEWRESVKTGSLWRRWESVWRALGYLCKREVIFLQYLCVRVFLLPRCFSLGSDIAPVVSQIVWNVLPVIPAILGEFLWISGPSEEAWRFVWKSEWLRRGTCVPAIPETFVIARGLDSTDWMMFLRSCSRSWLRVPGPWPSDWLYKKIPVWVRRYRQWRLVHRHCGTAAPPIYNLFYQKYSV